VQELHAHHDLSGSRWAGAPHANQGNPELRGGRHWSRSAPFTRQTEPKG
jgi:hypothetical protein